MLAALFTLYPFLFACVGMAAITTFALSATVNILLTMLCLALYTMIPIGAFDPWIDAFCGAVRSVIPQEADTIFSNLYTTFQYHEESPPEKALYLWHPHVCSPINARTPTWTQGGLYLCDSLRSDPAGSLPLLPHHSI